MAENGCVPGASSLEWVRVAAHKWRFSCQRQTDLGQALGKLIEFVVHNFPFVFGFWFTG